MLRSLNHFNNLELMGIVSLVVLSSWLNTKREMTSIINRVINNIKIKWGKEKKKESYLKLSSKEMLLSLNITENRYNPKLCLKVFFKPML